MKIAVIDMGTNTFHLLLVDVSYDSYNIFYNEKVSVKIGKNGISKGFITPEAETRAIDTIAHFKKEIDLRGISDIYTTATSAIRNARNGLDLLDKISQSVGISAKIISGREEAEFIYYGVVSAMKIGKKPALIMDIGGGSIEFIIANEDEIFWLQSYEIGGQRMIDIFHANDPITSVEVESLKHFLSEKLQELQAACKEYNPSTLIGCSGTFDTLSDIAQAKKGVKNNQGWTELPFEKKDFASIYKDILAKTTAERLGIPGMIAMRVDMIVVAMILIDFILDSYNIEEIRVSSYALKEGVLLKTIDSLKEEKVLRPNSV